MDKKENIKVKYNLIGIELLDVLTINPAKPLPPKTNFSFTINIEHKTNLDKKLIFINTTVDLFFSDESMKLSSIKTSCVFEINNIEEFISDKENKQIRLPDGIIHSLNSISIATTRGIMYSQFRGTALHSALLPLIDLKNLKKNIK